MRKINNFEKNRQMLQAWMIGHGVFYAKLAHPVKAEVFRPGNRGEGVIPEVVYCQTVGIVPRFYSGKVHRLELSFKDTAGDYICYNDLSDGNFYRNVLNEIERS